MSFKLDQDTVQRIMPNFDGVDGKSETYTVYLTNGETITLPCKEPKDFKKFEDDVKKEKKYKDLKEKKDKEKLKK